MSKPPNFSFTLVLTLFVSTFTFASAFAAPSAKDLLSACQKILQPNCQTQHLMYKTLVSIQQNGQAPTSQIQVTDIYKKKPGLMKVITDNGALKQITVMKGNMVYTKNLQTGKFTAIKSPFKIDPFQPLNSTLSDFDQATVEQVDANYLITLRGSKMPKGVERAEVVVDPATNTILNMQAFDKNGSTVMDLKMEYQKIGNQMAVKQMNSHAHSGLTDIDATMDVLVDERNENIPDSTFATN